MDPRGFLTLFVWITTFLVLTISADISPNLQSSRSYKGASVVRIKRQNSAEKWIQTILHRMNDLEDELALSKSAVEGLQGYFKTLGIHANASDEYNPRAEQPCGSAQVEENEMDWTPFGSSSCVKLMSGLYTFANASGICEEQYRIGEDLAHPVVVSVESAEKARDLLHILRGQPGLSHVWGVRRDTSPAGTVGLNCSELRIAGGNETEWRDLECGRLSGVVCEKPVVVSYVEMVRKQLEGTKRAAEKHGELAKAQGEIRQLGKELVEERRLRKEEAAEETRRGEVTMVKLTQLESAVASLEETARKAESENRELRAEMKSLLDSFRVEFIEKVARVESNSAANKAELMEVRREKKQLEEQMDKADGAIRKLRAEMKSLLDSFRADVVAQVESKSAKAKAELREMKQQKDLLERKLEEMRTSTAEDKRLRRVEEAEVRRLLKTLESETSLRVSTLAESSKRSHLAAEMEDAGIKRRIEEMGQAVEGNLTRVDSAVKAQEVWKGETAGRLRSLQTDLRGLGEQVGQLRSSTEKSLKRLQVTLQNVAPWQLGGITRFELQKAMGVWHTIEAFWRNSKAEAGSKCEEDIFSLKGINTVGYTNNYRDMITNKKSTSSYDIPVDPESPNQWKESDHNIWLKTDYENWAITLGRCSNQSISSCSYLWILSRTRTLASATLKMLRDAAETNGFPKANGVLYDQTAC